MALRASHGLAASLPEDASGFGQRRLKRDWPASRLMPMVRETVVSAPLHDRLLLRSASSPGAIIVGFSSGFSERVLYRA